MNIALDIDDTLTETFEYFLPFVAEYFDADINELKEKNISYSNLPPEWKPCEIPFYNAYCDKYAASTPFKSGAAEAVAALRGQGHRIIIITGRTTDFYTDPYETTAVELANGGIEYDKLICTLDKANACIAENVSLLIDDLPANCRAAAAVGIPSLLFTSKANKDEETEFVRVADWTEALEAVSQIK